MQVRFGSAHPPSKRKENRNRKGMNRAEHLLPAARIHGSIIAQNMPVFQQNRSSPFDPSALDSIYKIGFFAILAAVLGKDVGVCDIFLMTTIVLVLFSGRQNCITFSTFPPIVAMAFLLSAISSCAPGPLSATNTEKKSARRPQPKRRG